MEAVGQGLARVGRVRHLLIDTDPGIDDALALLIALSSDEVRVDGITAVHGNCGVEITVQNVCKLAEFIGAFDAPVFRGASAPLLREPTAIGASIHGETGLGRARLPSPRISPQPAHAVEGMIELVLRHPHEVTVLAIAPLTNVALAMSLEPRFSQALKDLVIMGGAIRVAGNVGDFAEFNLYADPHAAHIVFSSEAPITLVPLDVTRRGAIPRSDLNRFRCSSSDRELIEFLEDLTADYFRRRSDEGDEETARFHDVVALLACIAPEFFAFEDLRVAVEHVNPRESGRTRIVSDAAIGRTRPVRVALGIDVMEFRRWVMASLMALEKRRLTLANS